MSQLRVIKLIVTPVAVIDDGDHLTECKIEPLEVPASEVEEFVNGGLAHALRMLASKFETPEA